MSTLYAAVLVLSTVFCHCIEQSTVNSTDEEEMMQQQSYRAARSSLIRVRLGCHTRLRSALSLRSMIVVVVLLLHYRSACRFFCHSMSAPCVVDVER